MATFKATDKSVRDMKTTVAIFGNDVQVAIYLGRQVHRRLIWQAHMFPLGAIPGLSNPGYDRQQFVLGKLVEQGFDYYDPQTTRIADSILNAHNVAANKMERNNG